MANGPFPTPSRHAGGRSSNAMTMRPSDEDAQGLTATEGAYDSELAELDAYDREYDRRFGHVPASQQSGFRYTIDQYRRDYDAGRTKT